jgi:hypothetical protein
MACYAAEPTEECVLWSVRGWRPLIVCTRLKSAECGNALYATTTTMSVMQDWFLGGTLMSSSNDGSQISNRISYVVPLDGETCQAHPANFGHTGFIECYDERGANIEHQLPQPPSKYCSRRSE